MKRESRLKNIEARLIAELMKNSRRSDRELARIIGVSQPTVSRTIARLEKQGMIKEYTIIPDFSRLGYEIMGITSAKMDRTLSKEEFEKVRKSTIEMEKNSPQAALMAVNGIGYNSDRLFIVFYKNYSAYTQAMKLAKQIPLVNLDSVTSFLVSLKDETNYRLLSMSSIAEHLLKASKEKT